MPLKLVFLPADRGASCLLLPYSVPLLLCGTVQPENIYSCILKVTSTLIASTATVHFTKPVSTDATIKSDSVLTNPIGKNVV